MARQFGHQKVDLAVALRLVSDLEPIRYGWLVLEFRNRFNCSDRTAKDAISILRRGGWIEPSQPGGGGGSPQPSPARYSPYCMSTRGQALLRSPGGPALLRVARKMFTTCPSSNVRRYQETIEAREGLDQAFRRVETLTLQDDIPLGRLARTGR